MSEEGNESLTSGVDSAPTESAPVDSGPAIERPEWLLDKYAVEGRSQDEAIMEQAKAYTEASKMLGSFTGAPEEYEFTMPEGIDGEIDHELETLQQFKEIAKESNMNNETAQKLFELFVGYQNQMTNQFQVDFNEQRKLLGENADDRIRNVVNWVSSNLPEGAIEVLESMTYTADQVEVLEAMIGKTRNSRVSGSQDAPPMQEAYTWDDYHKAVGDERYKTDKQFREKHRRLASQLSGQ